MLSCSNTRYCLTQYHNEDIGLCLSVDPFTVWGAVQHFEEIGTEDSTYNHKGPPRNLIWHFWWLWGSTGPTFTPSLGDPIHCSANNQDKCFRISKLSATFFIKTTFCAKRSTRIAKQHNGDLCSQFCSYYSLYLLDILVFIGETGIDSMAVQTQSSRCVSI